MNNDTSAPPQPTIHLAQVIATLVLALDFKIHTASVRRDIVTYLELSADHAVIMVRTADDGGPGDRSGVLLRHEPALDMIEVRGLDGWHEAFGEPLLVDLEAVRLAGALELPEAACEVLMALARDAVDYAGRAAAEQELAAA